MFYFQKRDGKQVFLRVATKEELEEHVSAYFDDLSGKHGQDLAVKWFLTMECIQGD